MGLFDRPAKEIDAFLAQKQKQGLVRQLLPGPDCTWPLGSSLVLEEDAVLELGNPRLGSLSFMVWSALAKDEPEPDDRVLLIGPDLKEILEKSIPFGQVIRVRGEFRDEYECYRELREAVFDTRLRGFMTRVLPSRQTIWCRVTREARDRGFSLAHLGNALVRGLKKVGFVSSVEVFFVTSGKADIDLLKKPGEKCDRVVGALLKMVEEKSFDCDNCDYQAVCQKIEELKEIRKNLIRKKSR